MERLNLEDIFILPEMELRVAITTRMIYPGNPEKQSYQTMVFSMETDRGLSRFQRTYKTEAKARKGHRQILEWLKAGKYKLTPLKWEIKFRLK